MNFRCDNCKRIFDGQAKGLCLACASPKKDDHGTQRCDHCYRWFAHRPIMVGRKDYCSKACHEAEKALPKGDMKNKGSRTTPCGFGYGH